MFLLLSEVQDAIEIPSPFTHNLHDLPIFITVKDFFHLKLHFTQFHFKTSPMLV